MRSRTTTLALGLLAVSLTACPKKDDGSDSSSQQPMTLAEASGALDESSADSQAANVTSSTIEISTNFTIGSAVEAAAQEVRTFVQTQLPCAEITLTGGTLSVEYGKKAGNCTYRGQTFSGKHTVSIVKTAPGEIEVDHTWTDLSNGRVKVTGTAQVTWSAAAKSRHVKHELLWTRIADGRTGKGTGDRTDTPLEGGVLEGIQVDGARSWTGEKGTWDLAIKGVQMRWVDPVPQAGSYTLGAPSGRSLSLSFSRVDADTIKVTVASGERSFSFNVNAIGGVSNNGLRGGPRA